MYNGIMFLKDTMKIVAKFILQIVKNCMNNMKHSFMEIFFLGMIDAFCTAIA